jgi:hypothetical protein
VDNILPGLTLAICLVLLVRMSLSAPLRYRFDAAMQRVYWALRHRTLLLWNWRSSRQAAAKATEEAIRRARTSGERDGKVYRPDAFHKKPPKDKMH